MNHINRFVTLNILLFWACINVHADIITFESIPGGTPTEGMSISNQFQAEFGVSFSFQDGSAPVLAQVGGPATAFRGFNFQADTPAPGVDAGSFFLTDDGFINAPPSPLIISYSVAVSAASGIILDIDHNEAWQVQAFDANNNLLETINLGPNNQLDGSATAWEFDRALDDIQQIQLAYTGETGVNVGLAFDNFSPSSALSIPEPSSAVFLFVSVLTVSMRRRRRFG